MLWQIERAIFSNENYRIIANKIYKNAEPISVIACYDSDHDDYEIEWKKINKYPYCVPQRELDVFREIISVLNVDELVPDEYISYLKKCGFRSLRVFEDILINSGLFISALQVFEILEEKMCETAGLIPYRNNICAKMWAEVFRKRFVPDNYRKCKSPYLCPRNRRDFISLKDVLCNFKVQDIKKQDEFSSLITEKNIAVIGPAPFEIEEKLDSYNVLIVINPKEYIRLNKSDKQKIVAYFNYEAQKRLTESDDWLKEYDFVCLRSDGEASKKDSKASIKTRVYHSLDGMQLVGQPYMLQNLLFDLMIYNPKRIKLFRFSLYDSSTPYRNDYNVSPLFKQNTLMAFSKHNIINQYKHISYLYDNNLIEFDSYGVQLMKKGIQEYLKDLQRYYVVQNE